MNTQVDNILLYVNCKSWFLPMVCLKVFSLKVAIWCYSSFPGYLVWNPNTNNKENKFEHSDFPLGLFRIIVQQLFRMYQLQLAAYFYEGIYA